LTEPDKSSPVKNSGSRNSVALLNGSDEDTVTFTDEKGVKRIKGATPTSLIRKLVDGSTSGTSSPYSHADFNYLTSILLTYKVFIKATHFFDILETYYMEPGTLTLPSGASGETQIEGVRLKYITLSKVTLPL
jgi:hypothetical protein